MFEAPACLESVEARQIGAMKLASNPEYHRRTKHIRIFSNKIPHLRSTGTAAEASVLHSSIAWDTVLHSQFGWWRHPSAGDGLGSRFPDMAFESLPYVDLLLRDLGLKRWRKGVRWREWFEPYGLEDYKGLVGEWMETVKHPGGG